MNAPFVKAPALIPIAGLPALALPVTEKAVLHTEGLKRNVLIVKAPVIR